MRLYFDKLKNKYIDVNDDPKFIFFEGFDMVGKSYLMCKFSTQNPEYYYWDPDYTQITNRVLPYSHRYSWNLALFNLRNSGIMDRKIIVSRGIISGIVYNRMYHQGNDHMDNPDFINYIKKIYQDESKTLTIYIKHTDKSVKRIWDLSNIDKRRVEKSESYDKFDSLDAYIKVYKQFDDEYMKVLKEYCGDNFRIIPSMFTEED